MKTELPINQVLCGDCREIIRTFPSESIDMVMFSPPYWGLRDYGEQTATVWGGNPNCEHDFSVKRTPRPNLAGGKNPKLLSRKGKENFQEWVDYTGRATYSHFCVKCGAWKGQLGLEPDYRMYVAHMVEVCREIKRVLKKTGSMYIVMGDTYAGSHCGKGDTRAKERKARGSGFQDVQKGYFASSKSEPPQAKLTDYKPKCLMGIPWRVAFALIADGWILRNDICWFKPNAMPSSVKDRLTNVWEHIFHFVKSKRYFYDLDAIREPHKTPSPIILNPSISSKELDKAQKEGLLYNQKFKQNEQGDRLTKRLAYSRKILGKPHDSALNHPLGKNPEM